MTFDTRSLAVATAGFCAFVNLYSVQALLPALAQEFGVGAGDISWLMTAGTGAIALTAPFTGALADVVGRKRLITAAMFAVVVPTLLMTLVTSVPAFVFWRFVQGLLLPPIFTVAVAYIGDEWPPADVPRVAGLYISGTSIGGFCGRFIPGVLTDLIGWRLAFGVVALLTLVAAIVVTATLTRERHFVRSGGFLSSLAQMLHHLRDPQLVATYAIGFGVLFNFIATFTYVSFHLAAPPYLFSPTLARRAVSHLSGLKPDRAVGRDAPLRCSGAGRSCSASSPCGSSACCCCWRRPGQRDHGGTDAVRGLRHGVPGGLDRLCDHDRQGGAFVGRRSLRHERIMWAAAPGPFSPASPGLWPAGTAASPPSSPCR